MRSHTQLLFILSANPPQYDLDLLCSVYFPDLHRDVQKCCKRDESHARCVLVINVGETL